MKVGFCVMLNYELYDWETYNIHVKYIVHVCLLYKSKLIVLTCSMYSEFSEHNESHGLRIVVKYNYLSKRVHKKIVTSMDTHVNDSKKIALRVGHR